MVGVKGPLRQLFLQGGSSSVRLAGEQILACYVMDLTTAVIFRTLVLLELSRLHLGELW